MVDLNLILEWLDVNTETGIIRWKRDAPNRKTKAGDLAGTLGPDGRRTIVFRGPKWGGGVMRIQASRLIWASAHGRFPNNELDHINCNPSDNRLSNLRGANRFQNNRNTRKRKNNTSGYKGVTKHCQYPGKWIAQIMFERRHIHLGVFETAELAHAAYCEAANRLFGEFARAA